MTSALTLRTFAKNVNAADFSTATIIVCGVVSIKRTREGESITMRMTNTAVFSTIALLFGLFCFPWPACATDKLVLGVQPWYDAKKLTENFRPLVEHLQHETGNKVKFYIAGDYGSLQEKIAKKHVDVGIFSPVPYVKAKEAFPDLKYIATLVKRDAQGRRQEYYTSTIIANKHTGIRTLRDLRGRSFAFTDRSSSSGYVYPMIFFQDNHIDPETYFSKVYMLKKHTKVTAAIAKGAVDAGATYDRQMLEANDKFGDVLILVAEAGKAPFDAVACGAHVPDALVEKIKAAFLSFEGKNPDGKKLSGPQGFVVRSDAFYDIVRQAVKMVKQEQ